MYNINKHGVYKQNGNRNVERGKETSALLQLSRIHDKGGLFSVIC